MNDITPDAAAIVALPYEAEVRAGIALLDGRADAEGWRARIDRDRLNMQKIDRCILAFVYGSYAEGLDRLGWLAPDLDWIEDRDAMEKAIAHGFVLPDSVFGADRDGDWEYDRLAGTWLALLDEEAK